MINVLKAFTVALCALFICITGIGVIGFLTTPMGLLEALLFVYGAAFPMTTGAIAGEGIFLLALTFAVHWSLYGSE